MRNRVVITGMGAITPIGNSVNEFWTAVKAGKVGIDQITRFDASGYKSSLAAEVKNFVAKEHLDFKAAKRMELFSQYAVAAAKEAIHQSGLDMEKEDPYRVGVSVGSGVGSLQAMEREEKRLLEKGPNRVGPLLVPLMITNMAAGNISIYFGIKGKSLNIVTACATGTNSIGEAYRTIQFGDADVMIAGGTEASVCPIGVAGFASLTALSPATNPLRASIPFDKDRSGFIMGEGAAVMVLESMEHAMSRGASILAEVSGYGSTSDAYHITSPAEDGQGAAMAMIQAVRDAGLLMSDVDYINAHGTSTPLNDLFETRAIKTAFGQEAYRIPISSTKSMVGHLLGAAGGIELIACVKSIEDGYIHANIGLLESEEELDLNYVKGNGLNQTVNVAISNSLGFGGHNATLLVKRFE